MTCCNLYFQRQEVGTVIKATYRGAVRNCRIRFFTSPYLQLLSSPSSLLFLLQLKSSFPTKFEIAVIYTVQPPKATTDLFTGLKIFINICVCIK